MTSTTTNRIQGAIEGLRPRLVALSPAQRATLDSTSDVDARDHFAYQQEQAWAHAMGLLTAEEAMVIYRALGEVHGTENGGWTADADLATKLVVTMAIAGIMQGRLS